MDGCTDSILEKTYIQNSQPRQKMKTKRSPYPKNKDSRSNCISSAEGKFHHPQRLFCFFLSKIIVGCGGLEQNDLENCPLLLLD